LFSFYPPTHLRSRLDIELSSFRLGRQLVDLGRRALGATVSQYRGYASASATSPIPSTTTSGAGQGGGVIGYTGGRSDEADTAASSSGGALAGAGAAQGAEIMNRRAKKAVGTAGLDSIDEITRTGSFGSSMAEGGSAAGEPPPLSLRSVAGSSSLSRGGAAAAAAAGDPYGSLDAGLPAAYRAGAGAGAGRGLDNDYSSLSSGFNVLGGTPTAAAARVKGKKAE
jgi:hypothetical protein